MKKNNRLLWALLVLLAMLGLSGAGYDYEKNNTFIPDAFPKPVVEGRFSIPIDPNQLLVIYPPSATAKAEELKSLFMKKCGQNIPFKSADDLSQNDLVSRHLIIIGNISNNRWVLDLYKRRYAFSDAYFPGAGGIIVHPATSIWNRERNVIVIGVSRDEDILSGFERFVALLDGEKKKQQTITEIGAIHFLVTNLAIPKPPESIESTIDHIKKNMRTTMAPYWNIANWGLLYFLTGDKKWAEHFRDGMYLCYERAEKTGKWVPESWTNLYFNLWKLVYVWELLDDDPFFTSKDKKIIEEVLWGFTTFVRWLPNLDDFMAPIGEARQNHTTFLALSLFYAHRYYTEKYGIEGLDSMIEKCRRAFDDGQANSFRPNDDAGNYFYYAPQHLLTYQMALGDESFCSSGKLRSLIDLVAATIDNRRDPVSFGDVGAYSHSGRGSARGMELKFFAMGAWYYGDGQYQWLYNWGSTDRVISLELMKNDGGKNENPIQMQLGADRVFSVEDMYSGIYAVDIPPENPTRFIGVFPVILDEAALRWSARRPDKNEWIPFKNKRYFDKISYRRNFDPRDEYLLLDGLSTFSHGHQDGNTVTRLTWKDRIWLFDLDYIKMTPKYHNGVSIIRDGIQESPPPLNVLNFAADFEAFGFTRTTSENYGGADWERTIIWKKGRYFLFLDLVKAREGGDYRLECRWRTRGDVSLEGNVLSVRQGDKSFFIRSADDAHRSISFQPDESRSRWDYPYGEGKIAICKARKSLVLAPGDGYIFANLMGAVESGERFADEIFRTGDSLYVIGGQENPELVGLNPEVLAAEGVFSDCNLFLKDNRFIWLLDTTYLKFRDVSIEAPTRVHFQIDFRKRKGKIVIPGEHAGSFTTRNILFDDTGKMAIEKIGSSGLGSGSHPSTIDFSFREDFWRNREPFVEFMAAGQKIIPAENTGHSIDFGMELSSEFSYDSSITAVCQDGSTVIYGDQLGVIYRFDGSHSIKLYAAPSNRPILAVKAADIDGDSHNEIILGDDRANVFCIASNGKELWRRTMTLYYGSDANVRDVVVGDIDRSGRQTILVANGGWKVCAFNPDGSVKFESFCYYHPLTKIGILDNGKSGLFIPVGTEYHTPLNVIDPHTGKVSWYVWEEMGSEFIAKTEYCGFHLTDMVFVNVDDDSDREIVFGTKYNRVYALEPKDGAKRWEANVGGEVTVMKTFAKPYHLPLSLQAEIRDSEKQDERLPSGSLLDYSVMIAVGTDEGDLVLLDRHGQRINSASFGSAITDLGLLWREGSSRLDIALSTEDGRVIICDHELQVRASRSLGSGSIVRIISAGFADNRFSLYAIKEKSIASLRYHPYYLMKSRHY